MLKVYNTSEYSCRYLGTVLFDLIRCTSCLRFNWVQLNSSAVSWKYVNHCLRIWKGYALAVLLDTVCCHFL